MTQVRLLFNRFDELSKEDQKQFVECIFIEYIKTRLAVFLAGNSKLAVGCTDNTDLWLSLLSKFMAAFDKGDIVGAPEQFLLVNVDHRSTVINEITADIVELIHHAEVSVYRVSGGVFQVFDSPELDGDLEWINVHESSNETEQAATT